MYITDQPTSLAGAYLISTINVESNFFYKKIIYLFKHGPDGAMGFIINQAMPEFDPKMLLDGLKLSKKNFNNPDSLSIHLGGPVEAQRGFVIHSNDYKFVDTKDDSDVVVSSNLGVIEDIANGIGPSKSKFMLGYTSWGPGQLEQELLANYWVNFFADASFIFEGSPTYKWSEAMEIVNLDVSMMVSEVGNS